MMKYTLDQLSRMIDHTNLNAAASEADMQKLCNQAEKFHFKMVAINQVQSARCSKFLNGTDIGVGAAISFPLGQTSIEVKIAETEDAIKNGATEIDYVINLTEVKEQNWAYIQKEMESMVELCRNSQVISKVIFENAYLTDDEKIKLCEIAKEVRPDFIKTSTGFAATGAFVQDVKLMKDHVGNEVKVKASGGIRDAEMFKAMLAAGAERIGCSASINIIEELKKEAEENNGFVSID